MTVTNKESWRLVPWEGFGDLLGCPLGCRVRGDAEVNHFSSIVAQDNEHEEDLEGQGGDDEEIDGGRAMEVVMEERLPSVIRIRRSPGHVPGGRGLAGIEAELQELAVDARRAPGWDSPRSRGSGPSESARGLGESGARHSARFRALMETHSGAGVAPSSRSARAPKPQ